MIANKTAGMLVDLLKRCASKAKPLHGMPLNVSLNCYLYSTANVLYLTFYFMETILVLEIDNVIDIEDDLFWQCINAPHVRNDNTKL